MNKQKRTRGFKKEAFLQNLGNLQHTRKLPMFVKECYLVYLFSDQKKKN